MILIKDGRVVDPETGLDETLDLIIEDGRIKEIGKFSESESYEKNYFRQRKDRSTRVG